MSLLPTAFRPKNMEIIPVIPWKHPVVVIWDRTPTPLHAENVISWMGSQMGAASWVASVWNVIQCDTWCLLAVQMVGTLCWFWDTTGKDVGWDSFLENTFDFDRYRENPCNMRPFLSLCIRSWGEHCVSFCSPVCKCFSFLLYLLKSWGWADFRSFLWNTHGDATWQRK